MDFVIRGYRIILTRNQSPRPSFVRNILKISSYVNGRAASSKHRNLISTLVNRAIAIQWFRNRERFAFGFERRDQHRSWSRAEAAYSGIVSGDVSCKIRIPFFRRRRTQTNSHSSSPPFSMHVVELLPALYI